MAARTTSNAVVGILGNDYDVRNRPNLTGYISTAAAIVARVKDCASTNKGITLSTTELELIERWLAAHFYTKSDPVYQSKSTSGASASFVRNKDEPEPYRDAAINLDYSGCLKAILKRQFASADWLGRPTSEQLTYEERQ